MGAELITFQEALRRQEMKVGDLARPIHTPKAIYATNQNCHRRIEAARAVSPLIIGSSLYTCDDLRYIVLNQNHVDLRMFHLDSNTVWVGGFITLSEGVMLPGDSTFSQGFEHFPPFVIAQIELTNAARQGIVHAW